MPGPGGFLDKVTQSTLEGLNVAIAIPERAADDEDDQEPDRQARLNDLRFGWRLGQREAGPRTTHRNPTWLVEVSTGSACRAAGR